MVLIVSRYGNKARKLIIPLGDAVEVILAKGPDVTTYLKNGVVDLGIVGSDVLMNKMIQSYEIDLKKQVNANLSWPP